MATVLGKPSFYLPGGPGPRRLAKRFSDKIQGLLTPTIVHRPKPSNGIQGTHLLESSSSTFTPSSGAMPYQRRFKRSRVTYRRGRKAYASRYSRSRRVLGGRRRRTYRRTFRGRFRNLRRGRRFVARRGRGRGRRVRRYRNGPGWTYRTNVRPWPPTHGSGSGLHADSWYSSFDDGGTVDGVELPAPTPVVTGNLYPTQPAPTGTYTPGSHPPYLTVGALGNTTHPFFHTNVAFRLGDFPAAHIADYWDKYRFWRFGKCTVQFTCRAVASTFSSADLAALSGLAQGGATIRRGGDAVFCVTASSGPVPLTQGYTGANGDRYTNAQAKAYLSFHPFYRIINMDPARRRKFASIRRDMSLGMKPVTLKFTPKVAAPKLLLNWTSLSGVNNVFPPNNSFEPSNRYRYPRRPAQWHTTVSDYQSDYVDPSEADDHFIYQPHHGFCVSFRPGSWTEDLFPVLTYRVWVRVHFKGAIRSPGVAAQSSMNFMDQMNFSGPQVSF